MLRNSYFYQENYRKSLLKKVDKGPLVDYIKTPLLDKNKKISEIEFLSLDFETTGLSPSSDAILSVGCTVIKNMRVFMCENIHKIIKINKALPKESVVIHKITDERVKQGEHLHDVMADLIKKLTGRILLVHFADIERNFINRACTEIYGHKLPMLVVDTLQIEKNRLERKNALISSKQLRLFNIRANYGLPRYHAHSALEDAIATAELFLVQTNKLANQENTKIKSII